MKVTRIKKVNYFELAQRYKDKMGMERTATLDYRVRNFLEDLVDDGMYIYDYTKSPGKFRITFPLFIVIVMLGNIYSFIKWVFTADSRISEKSWFIRTLAKWDKYCGFKVL